MEVLRVRVCAVGGQELFNGPLAKSSTVGRLKEELLLLLLIPRAEQKLTCGQLVEEDDITLQALYDLKQEETELYGMLAMAHPATRRSSQSPHLDFSLFLRSGFYNFHVSKSQRSASPGLRVVKRDISPAVQRIFVEELMPGWSTTIQKGDELIEVNHRKVAHLGSVEFARLFDQALHDPEGMIQFHRGDLEVYFATAPGGVQSEGNKGVFCIIVNMSDLELIALRMAPGSTVGELKTHLQRLLQIPSHAQQLIHDGRALQEDEVLEANDLGLRLALLRVALFSQEEFGAALASGIHAELGLAFCDPAFLPPGRVAIASVDPLQWPEMLRFLGEDDFQDVGDGQVVAVLPSEDYQALLRLGPLNFLFHTADVPRAVPFHAGSQVSAEESAASVNRHGSRPKAKRKATG